MGLNSSLSSPTSEQVCLKRGGARSTDGSTSCNRMMILDHSLKGYRPQGLPRLKKELFIIQHEFNLVPSNLPAYQAVVIQQLSIG